MEVLAGLFFFTTIVFATIAYVERSLLKRSLDTGSRAIKAAEEAVAIAQRWRDRAIQLEGFTPGHIDTRTLVDECAHVWDDTGFVCGLPSDDHNHLFSDIATCREPEVHHEFRPKEVVALAWLVIVAVCNLITQHGGRFQ